MKNYGSGWPDGFLAGLGPPGSPTPVLDAKVSLDGHNISRCDRVDRNGGGVCFYIREGIGFEEILKYSNADIETEKP